MTTYIYRWQELGNEQTGEIDGPLLEIRGDAKSIFAVSKRLELPVRPFESEFLNLDETPADIFEALDAQTSDEKDEQRLADAEDRLWTRVGDAGDDYDHFSLEEMVDTLNDLQVGKVDHWVAGYPGFGFATPNYHGHDFVSCFWGNVEGNFVRYLTPEERVYVESNLKKSYL